AELKKRGLRVVPAGVRLALLRDIVSLLSARPATPWGLLVEQLAGHYLRQQNEPVSKSHVNDVLRLARRASVIQVQGGGRLGQAAVELRLNGGRRFQDAVIRCDLTYLDEIQAMAAPFDPGAAALALYADSGQTRYVKVLLSRYANGG
ncbi:MAG: hypothetical protein ACRDHL_10825, partial [Candidatus Promineifilaceae bacterium]